MSSISDSHLVSPEYLDSIDQHVSLDIETVSMPRPVSYVRERFALCIPMHVRICYYDPGDRVAASTNDKAPLFDCELQYL